eukprot:3681531-Rhodomonas_salina.2
MVDQTLTVAGHSRAVTPRHGHRVSGFAGRPQAEGQAAARLGCDRFDDGGRSLTCRHHDQMIGTRSERT